MSRVLGVLLAAVAMAAAIPWGGTARAQNEVAARQAFSSGKELYRSRRYVEAIAAFERAYELRPHHMVQCSIARCHENLNQPIEALRHFKRCLKEGSPKNRLAADLKKSIAAMEAQICQVEVSSTGKGGTVFVDGKESGAAPRTVSLNPGSHVIEVRRPGAKPASATIRVFGGERRAFALVPVDLAPKADTSARTPRSANKVPAKRRGLSRAWFLTATAVTAGLAVATTVLGAQTLGLRSDFDRDPTRGAADAFYSQRRLTNVFLGLTLAMPLGYGLVMLLARAYDTELFRMPIFWRARTVVLTVLLSFLFVLIAQWFVYHQVRKLDWLEGIKVRE